MVNYRTLVAPEETNPTPTLVKAPNLGWHLASTQERLQLGRPPKRLSPLLDSILALQAVALSRSAD